MYRVKAVTSSDVLSQGTRRPRDKEFHFLHILNYRSDEKYSNFKGKKIKSIVNTVYYSPYTQ